MHIKKGLVVIRKNEHFLEVTSLQRQNLPRTLWWQRRPVVCRTTPI